MRTDKAHKNIHLQCLGLHAPKQEHCFCIILSLMLQVTARSAECSTRSGWADQVRAKQQLVTEAGQRGCWDTQRLNRQPACHPLFFSSPYTQHITSDPSQVSLKEHGKKRVSHYHKKGVKLLCGFQSKLVNDHLENIISLTSFDQLNLLLYTYGWYSTFFFLLCDTLRTR